jgi:hypothetical protein
LDVKKFFEVFGMAEEQPTFENHKGRPPESLREVAAVLRGSEAIQYAIRQFRRRLEIEE